MTNCYLIQMKPFIEGERAFDEELAQKGSIAIYFAQIGDLNAMINSELSYDEIYNELKTKLKSSLPKKDPKALSKYAREILNFSWDLDIGDFVITPIPKESTCYIGFVTSGYFWNETENCHMRMVNWVKVAQSHLSVDLHKQLKLPHTVREINNFLSEIASLYFRFK